MFTSPSWQIPDVLVRRSLKPSKRSNRHMITNAQTLSSEVFPNGEQVTFFGSDGRIARGSV